MLVKLFLVSIFFTTSLGAQEKNPIEIILNAYSKDLSPKREECSLFYVPIINQQLKIRNDLLKLDLYEFGVLTSEIGFAESEFAYFKKNAYLNCLKTCNFSTFKKITRLGNAWIYSTHPAAEIRELGYYHNLLNKKYKLENSEKLHRALTGKNSVATTLTTEENIEGIKTMLNTGEKYMSTDIEANLMHATAICLSYSVPNVASCVKSLKLILEWMNPKANYSTSSLLSFEELIFKTALDRIYWDGANKAAIKISNRIRIKDYSGKLFDDLQSSFEELGLSPKEAYQRSWDIIGLYSTRGASIGETLIGIDKSLYPFALSMSVIANGMNVLDAHLFKIGQNYSYPKQVIASFDQGKPYHFWMSAYLSRRLTQEVGNKEAATIATFISQLGYQMKSATLGRSPNRAFTADAFSPANNKIRMDLAYAGAGARFGAKSVDAMPDNNYDIDLGFKKMILGSSPLKPVSAEKAKEYWSGTGAEGYFRWKRIFNPDVLLNIYK